MHKCLSLTPLQHPGHPDQRPELVQLLAPRREALLDLTVMITPSSGALRLTTAEHQVPYTQSWLLLLAHRLPVPSGPLRIRDRGIPEPPDAGERDGPVPAAVLEVLGRPNDNV